MEAEPPLGVLSSSGGLWAQPTNQVEVLLVWRLSHLLTAMRGVGTFPSLIERSRKERGDLGVYGEGSGSA